MLALFSCGHDIGAWYACAMMRHLPTTILGLLLLVGMAGAETLPAQKLVQQLKKTTDPEQAERLRERLQRAWLDAGPTSAQVLLKQAARAQGAGLVDTAEQLLRLTVRRWPDYAEARYRLAFLLWQRGRTDAALHQLDRLLARQPEHFPAASLRVRLLLEQQQPKQALAACRALLHVYPNWQEMRRRCQRLHWRLEQDA